VDRTLEFPDLLRLIDERSTAFRAAVASTPSLEVPVPTCPEWTLFDLAQSTDVVLSGLADIEVVSQHGKG
jgi:hypothetical protein